MNIYQHYGAKGWPRTVGHDPIAIILGIKYCIYSNNI